MRASSIHGLAGMAAIMASTYKAYMGEGLGDFGKWLMKFKIPHFGKVRHISCWQHACMTWMRDVSKCPATADRRPACAAATLLPVKVLAVLTHG